MMWLQLQTICYVLFVIFDLIWGSVVQLNPDNIDNILNSHQIVFVNFYADWCRFSQMLRPIWDESGKKIKEEFPQPNKVTFAQIDCDRENALAQRYSVSKYPTLKLFRDGQMVKREYRGQRSVEAFISFIQEQLKDSIFMITDPDQLDQVNAKRRHVIGYFKDDNTDEVSVFRQVASTLRADCDFHLAFGNASEEERMSYGDKVVFRPPGEPLRTSLLTLSGAPLRDYNLFIQWATDKCVPLVREITFENAEELTEEGLPFLILFHDPVDTETPEKFRNVVAKELLSQKVVVNFLTADGSKFTHPLFHLGKNLNDLPLIAIDSFKHMYLWNSSPRTDLEKPGALNQFILDLQSGKLHREFHQGPDPTTSTEAPKGDEDTTQATGHVPNEDNVEPTKTEKPPTSPPESMFKKLAPSRNRYTLLNRDEL